MKNFILLVFGIILLISCTETTKNTFQYPNTKRDSTVIDDYFGTKIVDCYRWLEDENAEETKVWVKNQNDFTNKYLEQIPYRKKLKQQLDELWDYETKSAPKKHGDFYIYTKNNGKQNQNVIYIKTDTTDEVLIDPNTFSEDGTVAIGDFSVSHDNKYAAFSTSKAGSDWKSIFILDVATKSFLKDTINWVKFSGIAWYKNGFFYSGYSAPEKGKEYSTKNEFHKVFYHELGTNQKQDKIIFENKERPLRNHYASITKDERILSVTASEGTSGNILFVKDLSKPNSNFIQLNNDFDIESWVVDNNKDELLIFTNHEAPNNRLVKTSIQQPTIENWVDVIPNKEIKLEHVDILGNKLFANYLKQVSSYVEVLDFKGQLLDSLKFDNIGICSGFTGDKEDTVAYYYFTSYIHPTTIFQLNTNDLSVREYFKPDINFNSEDFVTERKFYTSKDGTKIPIFISYRKDLKKDGKNPCLLYGYGGFNISYKPGFAVQNAVFMKNGGVYAVANLRGGGEFGEAWHKAGMLDKKQNVFDDFIAAAEFLKQENYTSTEKLAIHGRSNGGLLIGAVMTQRPDIAKVALPKVGVLDMLRYHKFTIGWAWAVEYGSSENKEQFEYLVKYSPLHNVKPNKYPATLVLTGDHDDRVVPAHSYKFVSALQYHQQGENPILIRIDVNTGHGSGKPKSKIIEEWADTWAFLFHNTNHPL
ncbi:MAG: prolyl oligopeptidase family serine peptidase [Vicingaceae bacterium]